MYAGNIKLLRVLSDVLFILKGEAELDAETPVPLVPARGEKKERGIGRQTE